MHAILCSTRNKRQSKKKRKRKKIYVKRNNFLLLFFPYFPLTYFFLVKEKLKVPSLKASIPFDISTISARRAVKSRESREIYRRNEKRCYAASIVHSRNLVKIWRSGEEEGRKRVRERALLPRWKFIHLERDRGTRYAESGRGRIARFIAFCFEFPFLQNRGRSPPSLDPSPAKTLLPAH